MVLRDGTTGRITGAGAPTLPFGYDDLYDPHHNKRIARRLSHLPRAHTLALVQGLLETDGCVSRGKELTFTSASEALAHGLRYQMLRLGVPVSGQKRTRLHQHEGVRSDGSVARFDGESTCIDLRIPAVPELAARLGCQALACGVEGGTAADFLSLARRSEGLTACLKAAKKSSAGQQLTDALMAAAPDEARLLQQPNALLAFEYARAMLKQEQPLTFLPLPRQGRHGDTGLGAAFASASALRQAMRCSGTAAACRPYLTAASLAGAEDQLAQGAFTDYGRYGDFVASHNRLLTPDQLRSLPAFTEGLENRWHRAFMESGSYDQALRSIKTRRYAYSRLCRMGAYTLLQPSRDLMDCSYEAGPQYARLLALNSRGAAFLKGAKGQLPVVTKVRSDAPGLSPLGQEQLKLDLKASDIQFFCFSKESQRKGRQDYYHSPFFLSIKK